MEFFIINEEMIQIFSEGFLFKIIKNDFKLKNQLKIIVR
jgi:hypothetical protein